jgi:MOSC domain-containing protein
MMRIEVGRVHAIYRYPVKSMAGESVDAASLGWHGLDGDRRFAFRRIADRGGFPWLTASGLTALILYQPFGGAGDPLPTHVRAPGGEEFELRGEALRKHLSERHGAELELMQLDHGIFDEAHISVISLATIRGVEREAGRALEVCRFRPNIVLDTDGAAPFFEDGWVGGTLAFGMDGSGAAVNVTMRDKRCMMINLDPDTAVQDPVVMKAVVRMNDNNAGVYGTVVGAGEVRVGQRVFLSRID